MSSSQVPRAVEGVFAWRDASWRYRAGLSLVLCAMAMLLIGPFLPWFHTEMIMPQPGFAGAPSTSPLAGLLGTSLGNVSGLIGIVVFYLFLALGASVAGIRTLTAAARHLDWTDARFVLDAGYYVTLAGYIVALAGNCLFALARRKSE